MLETKNEIRFRCKDSRIGNIFNFDFIFTCSSFTRVSNKNYRNSSTLGQFPKLYHGFICNHGFFRISIVIVPYRIEDYCAYFILNQMICKRLHEIGVTRKCQNVWIFKVSR